MTKTTELTSFQIGYGSLSVKSRISALTKKMYTYSVYISGVELGGLLEEEEAGVRIHHVLYEGHQVLRHQVGPAPASTLFKLIH